MLRAQQRDVMSAPPPAPRRAARDPPPPRLLRRDGLPALELTPAQIDQLRVIETRLLEQYVARYEDCVSAHGRAVDDELWRPVRQVDGVRLYQRRGRRGRGTDGIAASEPMLLGVGSIDGTLEDVLYGAMWSSRDERGTRSHFTRDGIVDAAVLAAVIKPTAADPFRSLGVKWALKRAGWMPLFVKDRDLVFLSGTGVIRAPSSPDARLGYELRHSLTIPAFPQIGGGAIVRAEILSCSLFRQLPGHRVEVFHQATFHPGGGLLSAVAWAQLVEAFVGFAAIVDCSVAKKLVRAVQWAPPPPSSHVVADAEGVAVPERRRCGSCGLPSGLAHRRCALCHLWVCAQCGLRRAIFPPLQGRPAVARCFCRSCLGRVRREDPTVYVRRDLDHFAQHEPPAAPDAAHFGLGARPITMAHGRARTGDNDNDDDDDGPVFFTLDSSPPRHRRRQGSVPTRMIRAPPPPPPHTPSGAGPLPMRPRRRPQSLATVATRATRGRSDASGEILLRSDDTASHRSWRRRATTMDAAPPPQQPPTTTTATNVTTAVTTTHSRPEAPPEAIVERLSLPGRAAVTGDEDPARGPSAGALPAPTRRRRQSLPETRSPPFHAPPPPPSSSSLQSQTPPMIQQRPHRSASADHTDGAKTGSEPRASGDHGLQGLLERASDGHLDVNHLLVELCEIARRTSEYTSATLTSMQAVAAAAAASEHASAVSSAAAAHATTTTAPVHGPAAAAAVVVERGPPPSCSHDRPTTTALAA